MYYKSASNRDILNNNLLLCFDVSVIYIYLNELISTCRVIGTNRAYLFCHAITDARLVMAILSLSKACSVHG